MLKTIIIYRCAYIYIELTFNNQILNVIEHTSEPYFYGSQIAKLLSYFRAGNFIVSPENQSSIPSLDAGLRTLINEIVL